MQIYQLSLEKLSNEEKEVYEFLKEYGFTRDEIHYFQDENEKMFFTNLIEVNKNIDFLKNKGLNKEEIMQDLLAEEVVFEEPSLDAFVKEWNINGENVQLAVLKK